MELKIVLFSIFFLLCTSVGNAQELFPINEPASNVPKGVVGVKFMAESYRELKSVRNQFSVRVMYGLTPKLTVWAQPMLSNHHGQFLPNDLIDHRHIGPNIIFFSNTIQYGQKYGYSFSGLHLYAKYRFLTMDENDSHFRMAAYFENTVLGTQAHDESEPHLQGDNDGFGAGIIATYLVNRFAVSFTGGALKANDFFQSRPDRNLNHQLRYGRALTYNLSFGYLVYPKKYKSYNHNNINLYVELIGRSYEAAQLWENDLPVAIESPSLGAGNYVDVFFGIQRITNSNDRVELTVGFPLINESYRHFYPLLMLNWQKYLFR